MDNVNLSSEAQNTDGSLSPVLTTSKTKRRILFGRRLNRQRSKVKLANKFECSEEPVTCSMNLNCPTTSNSTQHENQSDKAAERLRKIKVAEEERKRIYDYVCGLHGSGKTLKTEPLRDFEYKKPVSPTLFSKSTVNSSSNKSEDKNWESHDKDMNINATCTTIENPVYENYKVPKMYGTEPIYIGSTSLPIKNQQFSRIPRPNKTPQKFICQRENCLKPTNFRSASGKEIVISELEICTLKNIFCDENLDDFFKISPSKTKISVKSSSESNLVFSDRFLRTREDELVSSEDKTSEESKISSANENFQDSTNGTNSLANCTDTARMSSIQSFNTYNNSDSTVDSNNVGTKLIQNYISDTQMVFDVDNALSNMDFCSDDDFCRDNNFNNNIEINEKVITTRNHKEESCCIDSNNAVHPQTQKKGSDDFHLSTQETNMYFGNITLPENLVTSNNLNVPKEQANLENNSKNDSNVRCVSKESTLSSADCFEDMPQGVTSKSTVNVNLSPSLINCHALCSKKLVELHRNKNFVDNSEESVRALSNLDCKVLENRFEVKHKTIKTQKKCEGFCKCEQQEAEEKVIKVIQNVRNTETRLAEIEKVVATKSRKDKSHKERKSKKNITQQCTNIITHIIAGAVQEDERNVIEQEENSNIDGTEKRIENHKTKRKKDKTKHHKQKENTAEPELHALKKIKRDYADPGTDRNRNENSKCKQKIKEGKDIVSNKFSKETKQPKYVESRDTREFSTNSNQNKVKIEIDCHNKLRINISCNAHSQNDNKQNVTFIECGDKRTGLSKGTCDRSTSVNENVSIQNDAGNTSNQNQNNKPNAITSIQKKSPSESSILGNNVENYESYPYYCSLDFNSENRKMSQRRQNILKGTINSQKMDENVLNKNIDLLLKCSEYDKESIGFQSASGKPIQISADALKKAERQFNEKNSEKILLTSNKELKAKYKQLEQSITDSDLTLENIQETDNGTSVTSKMCGFTFASGKIIKIPEERIKKARNIFQDITSELDTQESSNNEKNYSSGDHSEGKIGNFPMGFKKASGKNILISEDALNKAQELYQRIDLPIGDHKTSVNDYCQILNVKEENHKHVKGIHGSPSKKAFELLEDVVETVDNALEKISTNKLTKSTCKRRLGILRGKQLPVSKEKLEHAKLLFQDLENSYGETTVNKSAATVNNSTPVRNNCLQSKDRDKLFHNAELSPIFKNTALTKDPNTMSSSIILHNRTEGSLDKWQDDITKQIIDLRRKLEILGERKIGLEIQKDSLQFGDKEHRRQRAGILFTNKQNATKRFPLKSLQWSSNINVESSDTIMQMTPKNAEYLHFNFARSDEKGNVGIQATTDGAMVIPNTMNLVGISEIEIAFKTMAGIEPGLIPSGWITNHYQLIVWKLASYEKVFPNYLKGCLNIENIIQQLKYRYDREIDRAQRSAIRKILEKDDVPQKPMVLCVSDIHNVDGKRSELQLTDGWYFVKTIIDDPLTKQVHRKTINVGTKLMIQGADILNCEGCHPLEVTDNIALRISYNCTRRAIWYAKLGYQRRTEPFVILMKTIHPHGGTVACLKMYVARVYPVRYMEQLGDIKIWRNERAEEKRAREFENEQFAKMEKIRYEVEKDYDKEKQMGDAKKVISDNHKLNKAELLKIHCPKTLYEMIETSNDPDSLMENLTATQRYAVLNYQQNLSLQRHQDISHRIARQVENLKLTKRKVTPVLKLLVLDANDKSKRAYQFYIWNPSEEHFNMLKEDSIFLAYNVIPRFNGDLFSNSKTYFNLEKPISSCHSTTKRQLFPFAMIQDPYYKPFFNEFDTVGLVVQVNIKDSDQEVWLGDFMARILYVKVKDSPKICCLLDCISRGQIVSLSNLIYCQPQKDFSQAIANQFSVISAYPQQKFLQEGIEMFKMQLSKDLTKLLSDCDKLIEKCRVNVHLKPGLNKSNVQNSCNISEIADDSSEDNTVIPTRLTTTDVAMSLIDTQQFY